LGGEKTAVTGQHRDMHLSGGPRSGQPRCGDSGTERLWQALAIGVALHLAGLHLDIPTGHNIAAPAFSLASAWRNLVLVAGLPTLMALAAARLRRGTVLSGGPRSAVPRSVAIAYGGLLTMVAVAGAWSPYPLAAAKMAAYVWSYGCLFVAYRRLRDRYPDALGWCAAWSAAVGLVLACVQTAAFGNPFGASVFRFTSFVAPQVFGLSLAILFALLLAASRSRRLPFAVAAGLAAAVFVASQMNGGRQGFLSIVVFTLAAIVPFGSRFLKETLALPAAVAAGAALVTLLVRFAAPAPLVTLLEGHGLVDLLTFTPAALEASGDEGTTRDRMKLYAALASRISHSSPRQILFGHGTSASAEIIAEGDVRYRGYTRQTMDPNRTAHNEFLRSLYEWGLPGILLFFVLVAAPVLQTGRSLMRAPSSEGLLLFAASGIAFLGYSMLGNMLAASSGPLGSALVLLYVEATSTTPDAGRGAERIPS
jgi:hypothetical protein